MGISRVTTEAALSQARGSLESGGSIAQSVLPEEIASSWHRCREMGLDPCSAPVDAVVSHHELIALRKSNERLMEIVRPELELLSLQIAGTNFMCAFADGNGVVLDAIMDSEFTASDCARSVRPGSVWREDLRGTNALGLSLYTGQASKVTGGEHFFACHGAVSCVSVPVFASDGSIVGLLDASSQVAERQAHTAALVNLSATNIENRLFVAAHRGDYILQFHPRAEYLPTQSVGMIAVDEAGRITGANRASARMLSGAGIASAQRFADLFRGNFRNVLNKLVCGEIVRLSDWLDSGYFARLHPTVPRRPEPETGKGVAPSALTELRKAPRRRALVWDDEVTRGALGVACRAATLGQPVCIRGAPGTGKTALAEAVHGQVLPDAPLISIDCRRLRSDIRSGAGQVFQPSESGDVWDSGGVLVLESFASLDRRGAQQLELLLDSLLDGAEDRRWCVLATDRGVHEEAKERVPQLAGLKMLAVDLPHLAARTDFDKIARAMLADLSPNHQLSKKALKMLADMDRPENLSDLRHHLQVMVASCPMGVLRDTQVARLFPSRKLVTRACPKCENTPIQRQRCLEIRRTFQTCQHNIARTARRLGVSRNTVYAHLKN